MFIERQGRVNVQIRVRVSPSAVILWRSQGQG